MTPQYPGSQSDPTAATKEKREFDIKCSGPFLYLRKAYIMSKVIFTLHIISLE